MLRMLLNATYAISAGGRYRMEMVKGAFEWRAAAGAGYAPDLSACEGCGADCAERYYLNVMNGSLSCPECFGHRANPARRAISPNMYDDIREAEVVCPLSSSALAAARYCLGAPLERLFSFDLKDEEDERAFSKTAETYLLSHLGRGFDSLNFYHTMREQNMKSARQKETNK